MNNQDFNMRLLKKIHSEITSKCNIAITRNWSLDDEWLMFPDENYFYDKFYSGDSFFAEAQKFIDNQAEDTYFSINSFRHKFKNSNDIWHLNCFALDFDYYKIEEFKSYSCEQMYETIKAELPLEPTAVVSSGRGMYIIYAFHNSAKTMNKTYQAIYHSFLSKFEKYGLDSKAMNLTQIIRMPGTLNSKSLEPVTVIDFNDTNYTMSNFYNLLPYTREEVHIYKNKKRRKKRKLNYTLEECKKSNDFKERFTKDFIDDLKKVIILKNRSKEYEGYREVLIFLARRRIKWKNGSLQEEIDIANELNEMFAYPLTQKELNSTKPYGQTKCPCIAKIISNKYLNLSIDQQKQMKVLKSKNVKNNYCQKKKRLHKLLNLTQKQIDIYMRRTHVLALKNQGYRNIEIARKLNEDKSTITKDLKYIKANPSRFLKKIEEIMRIVLKPENDLFFKLKTIYQEKKNLLEWLKSCEVLLE